MNYAWSLQLCLSVCLKVDFQYTIQDWKNDLIAFHYKNSFNVSAPPDVNVSVSD